MMHVCPVVVIFPRQTGRDATYVKQVGFADFYHGTKDYEHKMGLVQSAGPRPRDAEEGDRRALPRMAINRLRSTCCR